VLDRHEVSPGRRFVRTVLLRTSFSLAPGEAPVGALPATVASDEKRRLRWRGRRCCV